MADDLDTKSIVDMSLGAATTVAFAFGPVGVVLAGVLAVAKLMFDLFYQTSGLTDPMAQAPNKADLKNALDNLRAELDGDIFTFFTDTYQDDLVSASDNLNNAIHNAGRTPKAGACLPGPTTVWVNGQTDSLWQPISDNPDIFSKTMAWIEGSPSNRYQTLPLYALAVGLKLLYLKTALVWEINENLRDYETLAQRYKNDWATYNTLQQTWVAQGSDPATQPVKPTTPDPSVPTGGDNAVGSVTRDENNVAHAQSHLGKISSKWAIATRDLLNNDPDDQGNETGPIGYLARALAAYAQDLADKNAAIAARQAQVVSMPFETWGTAWLDPMGGVGQSIVGAVFAPLQIDVYKRSLAGNMDHAQIVARKLDKLTNDEVTKLTAVLACWRSTLKMYRDSLKNLDDGPVDPDNG